VADRKPRPAEPSPAERTPETAIPLREWMDLRLPQHGRYALAAFAGLCRRNGWLAAQPSFYDDEFWRYVKSL
jgi:hypothetical protein